MAKAIAPARRCVMQVASSKAGFKWTRSQPAVRSGVASNWWRDTNVETRNDKGPDHRLSLCGGPLPKTSWATPGEDVTEQPRGRKCAASRLDAGTSASD